jgi:hypothetical protein
MAVVQISKVQVRRGKLSQSTLPQLAGGELGWAVDTQQLFIGNGSVGEGAPFVGNTEVLTERTNIFDLLGAYTYRGDLLDQNGDSKIQTGPTSTTPITRSLQQKLDDFINIRDFGAKGDYSNGIGTDDTAAIQRAIDQTYLQAENKNTEASAKKIFFPAGVYKITGILNIPTNVSLIGEGKDKTVIFQDSDATSIMRTVSVASTPGFYVLLNAMTDNTAPSNVVITGFTFKRNTGSLTPAPIVYLDCLRKATFNDCKFQGKYTNGDGSEYGAEIPGTDSGVVIRSIGAVQTEDIEFLNCEFKNLKHGVFSDYDSDRIRFKNCKFMNLFRGLSLAQTSTQVSGQLLGPQNYTVSDSTFDKIDAEAWKVFTNSEAKNHRSLNNKFFDVGNNSLEQTQPTLPVLDFQVENCDSISDYFQRSFDVIEVDYNKTGLGTNLVAYIPDVSGVDRMTYGARRAILNFNTPATNPKILLKTPAWSSSIVIIDYVIKKDSVDLYRSGTLTINIHPDMTAPGSSGPTLSDNFMYSGQTESIGPIVGGNIRFFANVVGLSALNYSRVGNQFISSPTTIPTLVVRYANPSGPGGNAEINYTVTVISSYKDF